MHDPVVKICGITMVEDALYAKQQGANIIGVVRSDKSPRKGSSSLIDELTSLGITVAGVYTEMESVREIRSRDSYVQLHFHHGREEISFVKEKLGRRVISVVFAHNEPAPLEAALAKIKQGADLALLEYGQDGWDSRIHKIPAIGGKPIGVAGRVTRENLRELIRYWPHFIDVSSSLEDSPGKKSHSKIKQFMEVLNGETATV